MVLVFCNRIKLENTPLVNCKLASKRPIVCTAGDGDHLKRLAERRKMKLEELASIGIEKEQADKIFALAGRDIEQYKQTISKLKLEMEGYKDQLSQANKRLEGYDPEWKEKSEKANADALAKIADLEYTYAAMQATNPLKFSSESAKKAFVAELKTKKFPMENGKILGFEDFLSGYKESDPNAFAKDGPTLQIGGPAQGSINTESIKDKANAALRAAFGKEG